VERRQIATLAVIGALGVAVLAMSVAPIVPGASTSAPDITSPGIASPGVPGAFDPASLVNLTEPDAYTRASQAGWAVRTASRDGETFALTQDYSPTRVNLTVADGTVRAVTVG
jgi:hypothetical protein